eukprot:gene8018-12483_t
MLKRLVSKQFQKTKKNTFHINLNKHNLQLNQQKKEKLQSKVKLETKEKNEEQENMDLVKMEGKNDLNINQKNNDITVEDEFTSLSKKQKEMYELAISEEMKKFKKITTQDKIKTIEYSLLRGGEYSCVEERLEYEGQGYRELNDDELKHRRYLILLPFLVSIPSAFFMLFMDIFK